MQIIRKQENSNTDTLKQVHLKVDREDGDTLDRWKMEAYMYPNYEPRISLKIPSVGFSLSIEEATNLHALLEAALLEFKE